MYVVQRAHVYSSLITLQKHCIANCGSCRFAVVKDLTQRLNV